MMRAISLWQPWASAVALGSKTIETRHWSTDYRGPLAIHAAKRRVLGELIHLQSFWNWQGAMSALRTGSAWVEFEKVLPYGAIVAVATLADCLPTDSFTNGELDAPRQPQGESSDIYNWTERQMGNFELGRFGWVLSDIRPLIEPVPFIGRQGFFNVPDDLLI
jgi:hypothetical protein